MAQCDDIIAAYSSLIQTAELNNACEKAHGTGNEAITKDLSVLITNMKCLSIVFSIRHRNKATTAMEDCNNAIKLQRFVQNLEDMRMYYNEGK